MEKFRCLEDFLKSFLAQLAEVVGFSKVFHHTDCPPLAAIRAQIHLLFPLLSHFEFVVKLQPKN